MSAPTKKPRYKVIGTRPLRHDGVDKVTGRAKYGADVKVSGLIHGVILRSPHAHARIKSIDTTAAKAMPGVHAVITNADLPHPGDRMVELGEGTVNLRHLNANILASGKVVYRGQAVAAVAADSVYQAEAACQQIKIEYEPLPPVMDVQAAMLPTSPVLHDDVLTKEMGTVIGTVPSNVAEKLVMEKGDLAAGFKQAAVVIEREFHTATVHQGYIEPHTTTALWHQDGRVTVWTTTQGAFSVRQQVAALLQIPQSGIRVIPMEIGGGFGGKICVYEQPVAVLLSKKSGRPVRVTMNRTDVFEGTGPTPGSYIKVKMGVDKFGKITAAEATLAYEAGGFPGSPVGAGCVCVLSCYDIPNARVTGYDVCVNKPRTSAYRAPGSTNAAFAVESVVEEICQQLKLDPIEFRLKNVAKEGTRRVDGLVYPRIGLAECLEAVKGSDHWKTPIANVPRPVCATPPHELHHPNPSPRKMPRGRGVASGFWMNVGFQSSVTVSVNGDGKVTLIEGSTDIGGTRTSIAMQLAETLGIAVSEIYPVVADTDGVGYTDVTGGSRVTHTTGWAAHEAGLRLRDLLCNRAAKIWSVDPGLVTYVDGEIHGPANNGKPRKFTFAELSAQLFASGEPITATANIHAPTCGGSFGSHVVDVEVDTDTGKVTILRYTATQDAGTAIHPAYVEGQMHGGVAQGIGWALNEEYFYDTTGTMRNSTLLDYRVPTCFDLPNIETIIVEVPNPDHPYGVRGVGEVPICPPPAAIAAAIYNAVGVRMLQLPMSPPRLLKEILGKRP